MRSWLGIFVWLIALGVPSAGMAQDRAPSSVGHGVPSGEATSTPIDLSLAEAVRRGLAHNLAVILEEQRLKGAESARLAALSELLPHVSGSVRQSEQVISTAEFGFKFPGVPTLIGPFGVFDARVSMSAPLYDARASGSLKSRKATVRAGQADVKDVRETVVLAVATLYLQAEADAARIESARAQAATAAALVQVASDQRDAGVVAGIDVVRQQVQLEAARARLITAENAFEKRKLMLARAIGLPAAQPFTLGDATTFIPWPAQTVDEAVAVAEASRSDLKAAQARVDAARETRHAEAGASQPSVHVDADVGALGTRVSDIDRTYAVAAVVRVPIFQGGEIRARVQRAEADLRQREAELADVSAGVRYEVEGAVLDIKAADAAVHVGDRARDLSRQELDQAQDRFRAGVSSTLELVQAQESVASATEQYITSVYEHAIAKAALARAVGQVEGSVVTLVGGRTP
jgi:outer membrane protein TolC